MADALAAKGRVMVGWTEILEGGAPPGAVIMVWRGEDARQVAVAAAEAGHDVVMSPETWTYFDWAYTDAQKNRSPSAAPSAFRTSTGSNPYPQGLPAGLEDHILGTQCQLWTEYVPTPEHAEYMYFPRVCAFSEVAWSARGEALGGVRAPAGGPPGASRRDGGQLPASGRPHARAKPGPGRAPGGPSGGPWRQISSLPGNAQLSVIAWRVCKRTYRRAVSWLVVRRSKSGLKSAVVLAPGVTRPGDA